MSNNTKKVLNHFWKGLRGFAILTVLFFLGEWISGFIPIPVPGAVIGMVVIFLLLHYNILPLRWVDSAAVWLLSFLGLFYVPYGVGIIDSGELIEDWGIQIVIIVVMVVLSVFAFTGWLFQSLCRVKSTTDE